MAAMNGFGPSEQAGQGPAAHWLVRVAAYLRPREGWLVLSLAWAAVISLPGAAVEAGLVAGLGPILWLATLGLIASWWLAGRRIAAPSATALLAAAGVVADLIWGVRVLGPGRLIPQAAGWLAWRLGEQAGPAPAITYFSEQWAALASYAGRVAWWAQGLVSGQGAPDNLVVIGLAGLLAWAVAAWAGWWIVRREQPFIALLPTGILLAQQVYWASDVRWALLFFLGATALLLVAVRWHSLTARWERTGTDYSPELRLDWAFAAAGITALALILAPTIPFLTSSRASEAFWRLFAAPYREVEESLARSFEAAQPARSLVPAGGVAAGGLPRAHLLGAGPELADVVALRGRVRGLLPGQPLAWRGQTFAHYTGRGWDEPTPLDEVRLAAGEPWTDRSGGVAPPLSSAAPWIGSVEALAAARNVLYVPGAAISADRPTVALLRRGDLAALSTAGQPARYTVLAAPPITDAALLRRAGTDYPPAIAETYLQLPMDVLALDPRLTAFAQTVAAGAATPYDRAVAIEAALRAIPYSLDVPTPPAGREVVGWFLFDLRRGYCDYFATAMVVLARLNGIPGRLAVGYAAGVYDEAADLYTVRELDAHAWPELYFPGLGWIPFEPTPAFAVPVRDQAAGGIPPPGIAGAPPDLDAGLAELRSLAEETRAAERRATARGGLLAGLNGLLALSLIASWLGLRRGWAPGQLSGPVAAAYDRLLRWGGRLGRPARPADTPREYAAALAAAAARGAGRARWGRGPAMSAAAVVGREADALALEYERALFGGVLPARQPAPAPRRDLWAALRRVWWAQRLAGK